MPQHVEILPGQYHDSVTLMLVSQDVGRRDDVDAVLVAMATELNLEVLTDMGLSAPEGAGPNDLVVGLIGRDDSAIAAARQAVDDALAAASQGPAATGAPLGGDEPPRTLAAAVRRTPADLALVSVPGQHAFVDAMDALRAGVNVMIYSDNVPVAQEVALKAEAGRRGRLVMGPDAGTAIVGGVGLGFANAVQPGPVGVVAASGTGAQQVCCLLDDAGVGVSHVLGVGGRDLSAQVGGASTLAGLAALDADPATQVIVVLSKPPDAGVAERVRAAANECTTPVVLGFVGRGQRDLGAITAAALDVLGRSYDQSASWGEHPLPAGEVLQGYFAGGTLCDEAMVIAAERLGPIRSNTPLEADWALPASLADDGHWMIDFGEDELTRGRPHPMIDQSLRSERLQREAARGRRLVALADVVLGYGAHPDPAAELAPVVRRARDAARAAGGDLAVVVSLVGTRDDPQDRDRQASALADAGCLVHLSNAAAARAAVDLVETAP